MGGRGFFSLLSIVRGACELKQLDSGPGMVIRNWDREGKSVRYSKKGGEEFS